MVAYENSCSKQAVAEEVRKFDYQRADALDCLFSCRPFAVSIHFVLFSVAQRH